MKNLLHYGKVQRLISFFIRSRPVFVGKGTNRKTLLNVGCGQNIKKNFINLDYHWAPGVDVCWNIEKDYPLRDNSLEGIYTEHCLEHITLEAGIKNIKEFYRMLRPGGVLRIVVPDGELYFKLYNSQLTDKGVQLPWQDCYISAMDRINALFRKYGHQFIYDFETFQKILRENNFKEIKKVECNSGREPRLLIDEEWRAVESLYIECIK